MAANRVRASAGPMDDDQIEALVSDMIDSSIRYIQDNIAPLREKATNFYHARPFKNEEEGRSQVVSTDVREGVLKVMPSLMRIFTGPERYVEFRPRGKDDEALVRQMTDYINFIITEDNDGFIELHSAFKDALIRKTGVLKWWVDEVERNETTEYTGLTQEQVFILEEQDDVTVDVKALEEGLTPDSPPTFRADVTKHWGLEKIVSIGAVPNEEISWNRSARSAEEARIIVHRREVRRDELIGMGFTEDDLEGLEGEHNPVADRQGEAAARRIDRTIHKNFDDDEDDGTQPVVYSEAYVFLTVDGVNEPAVLCKVSMAGTTNKLLDWERVSHRPFAFFCPDPEAHEIIGTSLADNLMDIQLIKSAILRGTLDSLSLSLYPATEVVEGEVNMQDAESTEIGRHIRVRQPGMMREIKHAFVGGESMPMVEHFDRVIEQRLGISNASAGLDADAMQSTTKAAVAATLSAAQQRLELLARIFAETGMKALFKGILRTVVENQNRARTIRLRGEYVEVDPRAWDANMDVIVNVALGQGLTEEKVAQLAQINAKQEQILAQTGGQGGPLVSLTQYSQTLHRMVELVGFKNTEEFFGRVTPEMEQQMAEAAQQEQKPGPEETIAQAELVKAQTLAQAAQADAQEAMRKLDLQEEEMRLRDDRERDKQAADIALRIEELNVKHAVTVTREGIEAAAKEAAGQLERRTRIDVAQIQASAKGRASE